MLLKMAGFPTFWSHAQGWVCAQAACAVLSGSAAFLVPLQNRILVLAWPSKIMASWSVEELQKDLEEAKVLHERTIRKRVHGVFSAEKSKVETEIKNKMQQKSQRKGERLDHEKPAAVGAPIATGYTVTISNYGWDQSDTFVKISITFTGVLKVHAENVQVHFTERSCDSLVKNPNGKRYYWLWTISWNSSLRKLKKESKKHMVGLSDSGWKIIQRERKTLLWQWNTS